MHPSPNPPVHTGLTVNGLTRRFGRRVVVNQITFTVPAGGVIGLLGPNGCGKSTSLKMLAGALTAHDGNANLSGAPVGVGQLATKAATGYIPDVGGLFPRLTGTEHLELTARLFRLTDWRTRAAELLDDLELADTAHQPAGTYSHGMSRKLSAAIALLPQPRLLLADEPFDGVDQTGIDTLTRLFTAAAGAGAAVLLTTHRLDVAADLCEHVHLMRDGTIIAAATPSELAHGSLADTYRDVLGHHPDTA